MKERTLLEKAIAQIKEYNMFSGGDTVAVGVSGGADSVALLDVLCQVRETWSLTVLVCHLNHGLRGEESLRDEAFVEALAKERDLMFHFARVDAALVADERGQSVEEASRDLRYEFLENCAGENGKIATAHTLTDSVETLLFNMARGSGVKGLRGIPPVRGRVVRPLVTATRQEVLDHCRERGLRYVTDSTNASLAYTRNRIRHQIVPVLEDLNPGLSQTMLQFMSRMDEQWEMTEHLADEAYGRLWTGEGLLREGFLALPKPVAGCLLQRLLEASGAAQSARILALMEECAGRGNGAVEIAGGVYFFGTPRLIGIRRREEPEPPFALEISRRELLAGGIFPAGAQKWLKITIVHSSEVKNSEFFYKELLKNTLDYDRIDGNVLLRSKQDGDKIALAKSPGSRPLKKLYNEAGIPPARRGRMAVLTDRDGKLLWAEGFGPDRSVSPDEDTKIFLTIEVLEDKSDG